MKPIEIVIKKILMLSSIIALIAQFKGRPIIRQVLITGMLVMVLAPMGTFAAPLSGNGTVILAFDDGWYSVLQYAKPIMDANNQTGVVFAIADQPEQLGNGVAGNYMNLDQLSQLYSGNWDISSHSMTHGLAYPDMPNPPTNGNWAQFYLTSANNSQEKFELGDSKDWLDANGFTNSSMFFAYPYGTYDNVSCLADFHLNTATCGENNLVLDIKSAGYYIGARSIDAYSWRHPDESGRIKPDGTRTGRHPKYKNGDFGENPYNYAVTNDPNNVYRMATMVIDNTPSSYPSEVIDEINKTIKDNGLLVLTFHKVVAGSPAYDTEYNLDNFTKISNYLKNVVASGNVDVTTFSKYFNVPYPIPVYVPGTPVKVASEATTNSIKMKWSDGPGDKTDVFDIELNNGVTTKTIYNVVDRFVTITGLSHGVPVSVKITPINRSWGDTNKGASLVINEIIPKVDIVGLADKTIYIGENLTINVQALVVNATQGTSIIYAETGNGSISAAGIYTYNDTSVVKKDLVSVNVNDTYSNKTVSFNVSVVNRPLTPVGNPTISSNDMVNAKSVNWSILAGLNTNTIFYGIDNLGTETLKISNVTDGVVAIGDLEYNTVAQPVNYLDGTGKYYMISFIGQRYVALNDKLNKLTKIVMNSGDINTVASGSTWTIGDGWLLKVNSINSLASPKQADITLTNGVITDNEIVKEGTFYTYNTSVSGETNAPVFRTYVNSVTDGNVSFKNTWAVSMSVSTILSNGVFSGATVSGMNLTLKNNVPVTINHSGTVPLMENLSYVVDDMLNPHAVFASSAPLVNGQTFNVPSTEINTGETLTLYTRGYNVTSRQYSPWVKDSRTILSPSVAVNRNGGGGGGSGGSGGGGAGAGSVENFSNILKSENKDGFVQSGKDTILSFTTLNPNGIFQVVLSGQSQDVNVRVENLKEHQNTTTDVSGNALLYTNVMINSVRIDGFSFVFKIDKNNITNADNIKVFVWNNDMWNELETKVVNTDSTHVYFQVVTVPAKLSKFAISEFSNVGMSSSEHSDVGVVKAAPPSDLNNTGNATKTNKAPGFEGIVAIVVLSIIYLRKKL